MSLHRRIDYQSEGFDPADAKPDPFSQWFIWFEQAEEAGCIEPNAMVVSTIGDDDVPDSRNVLIRGMDDRGLVFYTNYRSNKSSQLAKRSGASAVFSWLALHRQVKFRGRVEQVSADDADRYFASRPRDSQIGAWASPQSSVIPDRATLDRAVADVETRYAGVEVPRPPHWGGWRLIPHEVEFWQGRPNRLHDRVRYRRNDTNGWHIERLAP